MSNLNLKGLWILTEILTDTNLSDKEKCKLCTVRAFLSSFVQLKLNSCEYYSIM